MLCGSALAGKLCNVEDPSAMDAKSAARWAIDLSAGSSAVPAKRIEPEIVCIMATKGDSIIPHSTHVHFYAPSSIAVISGGATREIGKSKPTVFGANHLR